MAVVEGRLADGFLPVGMGVAQQFGIPATADVFLAELVGIIDLEFLVGIVDGIVTPVGYPRRDNLPALGLRTFLGGDDDDAVRAPRAVNGGGGGVLQDVDRLDVIRIDRVDALADHSVDDDERLVGGVQGSALADTDRTGGTGGTGALGDLQTGDLTEKEVFGRVGFHTVKFIRLHGYDRSGGIGFLDFTITDDNHLVEVFVVFGQLDPSRHLGCLERDGRITDAADLDGRIRTGHTEDEVAVQPG